jgi:hypothetical protein
MSSPLDLGANDADPSDQDESSDSDDDDSSDDQSAVDASTRLINSGPINVGHSVDEPITSGGDAGAGPDGL